MSPPPSTAVTRARPAQPGTRSRSAVTSASVDALMTPDYPTADRALTELLTSFIVPNYVRNSERRQVHPAEGRVALRRKRTEDEIVAAAWDLVHEHGLASLSMRDLGDRVGMKAQSLYSYFASKNDIYDAMFREGQIAFAVVMTITPADSGATSRSRLRCAWSVAASSSSARATPPATS